MSKNKIVLIVFVASAVGPPLVATPFLLLFLVYDQGETLGQGHFYISVIVAALLSVILMVLHFFIIRALFRLYKSHSDSGKLEDTNMK